MPKLGDSSTGQARLVCWLVEPHDRLDAGTPVAIVQVAGLDYEALANGTAFVDKLLHVPGDALDPGESMATVDADGECIPYGKPYSPARRAWQPHPAERSQPDRPEHAAASADAD